MYRTIDSRFWNDPKVRSLSRDERYLFLYLITNPHVHLAGIYYLPEPLALHETGLSRTGYRKGINTLSREYLVFYDEENQVIFVKNMLRYQGGGKNHWKAAINQLACVHNSCLINNLLEEYPEIKSLFEIAYRKGIKGVSGFFSQEKEKDKEKEKDSKTRARGAPTNKKVPTWYLQKMKKAFRAAGERLTGTRKITEEIMRRQVEVCCQEINLEFREDAFLRIYHGT